MCVAAIFVGICHVVQKTCQSATHFYNVFNGTSAEAGRRFVV